MTIRTSILLEMSVLDLKDKKKKKEGLDFTSDVNLDIKKQPEGSQSEWQLGR